jgi:hypothetical protein
MQKYKSISAIIQSSKYASAHADLTMDLPLEATTNSNTKLSIIFLLMWKESTTL